MKGLFDSIITPKIGLGLMKKEIERQADIKVKDFAIVYHRNYENMKLNIIPESGKPFTAVLPDESGKVHTTIEAMIKAQLHEDLEIEAFKVAYENKKIIATVYYIQNKGKRNEEKIKQSILI